MRRGRGLRGHAAQDDDARRARRAALRLDARRSVPGARRRGRHRRRLAVLRLRSRFDRALRLGGGPARRVPGARDHAAARAPSADQDRLQRLRPRAGSHRRWSRLCAAARRRRRRGARPRRRGRLRPVHGQPDLDHRRRRRELAPLALRARPHEHPLDDRAVLADGLGGADAGRALAALAVPLGGARRPAARDPALPARDRPGAARHAARADRPADRARQPPALPRTPRAGAAVRARACVSRSRSASSTSTTSSGSTTASATRPATASSRRLASRLRQTGEAFRLGGDEFALLLPGYDEDSALDRRGVGRRSDRGAEARAGRLGHRQRRRRHLAAARRRARRAGPARRQRPLLGQGVRQEPRPRLPARRDRARRAQAAGGRPRPRRPLPRRREPRAGRRRPRRLHGQPLPARRRPRSAHGAAARASPTRRSSSPGSPPACTTSASSRSPRRSCASRAR